MSADIDIFISYKREERQLAQDVARALQDAGYAAVSDLNIRKGEVFGDAIEQMIIAARLVVVLWTPASTSSDWVRKEACKADDLAKYLGVAFKPVHRDDLPFQLQDKQYLDLTEPSGRNFALIVKDVEELIGKGSATTEEANKTSEELTDDFNFFQVMDRLGHVEGYRAYLNDYPSGIFAERAQAKMGSAPAQQGQRVKELEAEVKEAQQTIKLKEREHAAVIAGLRAEIESYRQTQIASEERVIVGDDAPGNQLTYADLPNGLKCEARLGGKPAFSGSAGWDDGVLDGLDSSEIIERGDHTYVPGVQLGGHCIPIIAESVRMHQLFINDVSVLSFLPQLKSVDLSKSGVCDVSPLEGLPELVELNLERTPVKDLQPLSQLKTLRILDLGRSQVKELDALLKLPNLHYLRLPSGDEAGNKLVNSPTTRQRVRDLIESEKGTSE